MHADYQTIDPRFAFDSRRRRLASAENHPGAAVHSL